MIHPRRSSPWCLAVACLLLVATAGCEVASFAPDSRRQGLKLYNQGLFADAAGSFQNAVRQSPTDYRSHYYMGLSFEKLQQNQRAIAALKSARDTRLQTGVGLRDLVYREKIFDALARNLATSADRDREIQILRDRAAVARDSDDWIVLARMFRFAGDPDNAIATYETAVRQYPRDHALLKEYGLFLRGIGLTARAREVLLQASRLRPDRDVSRALAEL